jgi:hypothetical protein
MRLPSAGGWWSLNCRWPSAVRSGIPYVSQLWQSESGVISERKELLGFVACDADYSCALHPTDPQVRIL